MKRAFSNTAVLAGLAWVLAGCTTIPSEFYMLDSLEPPSTSTPQSSDELSLGVGPIKFPDYLDRPQIVTRPDPNRVELNEFRRWAGSLQGNFRQVLARNLGALLGSRNVAEYPWDDPFDPDYRLVMDLYRFDGKLGGEVSLEARWSLTGRDRTRLLRGGQTSLREPVVGEDYQALVEAESRALEALSREIAAALAEVSRK
jgi:uncharacterized lipoprotein YmbA